ncbi:MAG: hypothetical protein AB7S38_08595 [Vulcanimicrobiota bacterium]
MVAKVRSSIFRQYSKDGGMTESVNVELTPHDRLRALTLLLKYSKDADPDGYKRARAHLDQLLDFMGSQLEGARGFLDEVKRLDP